MLREEFTALGKQGFNRIPLVKEVLADLETPLSLYVKLTQAFGKTNTYLLESVLGGERFGRFSFIGLPAKTIIKTVGKPSSPVNEVVTDGKLVETNTDNPLDFVDAYFKRFKVAVPPGLPRFCGGLAGYFGYDTVRYIESRLAQHSLPDELGVPDIGLRAIKFRRDGDVLVGLKVLGAGEELLLVSERGVIVRTQADAIPQQSRAATGVRLQKLDAGDRLAEVVLVPPAPEEEAGDLAPSESTPSQSAE